MFRYYKVFLLKFSFLIHTSVPCMQLVAVDMVGYIVWVNVSSPAVAVKAVRWSRPLRPLFLINFPEGRQVRLTSARLVLTTDQSRDHQLTLLCTYGM